MKKVFFVIIMSSLTFLTLYADNIQFNNRNSINIDIPVNWKVTQHQGTPFPEMGATFDIRLTPPSNEKALLTITIGKSQTGKPLTQRQYDSITRTISTEYLKGAVEKNAAFTVLPIKNGNGKYSVFTDASLVNKTPGPNDFVYAVLFLANYSNGCFLYATGLTADLSGAAFQNMVKSISSIEPSLAAIVQTPPVQIRTNNQGVLIGNAASKVKLLIPSKTVSVVKERIGGGQNNPGYFYLTDSKVNLNLSGWFEPAEKFKYSGTREFWVSEYSNTELLNLELYIIGIWEVFIYDMPVPKEFPDVSSAHIRANLLQDNIWIDLHLSITADKPSSILHDELAAYLKTLQIIK